MMTTVCKGKCLWQPNTFKGGIISFHIMETAGILCSLLANLQNMEKKKYTNIAVSIDLKIQLKSTP